MAELTTANIWCVKDGEAFTPVPNGCFPQRHHPPAHCISLLRGAGIKVHEVLDLKWDDLLDADEVFSTGNYSKVAPITGIEDRSLQPGPVGSQGPRTLLGLRARATVALNEVTSSVTS